MSERAVYFRRALDEMGSAQESMTSPEAYGFHPQRAFTEERAS